MRAHDPDLLDEEQIRAALEAAINQPLSDLLSIAEFVEKADLPAVTEFAEAVEPDERRAAA